MLTAEFDYNLPSELIAQRPLPRRDQSRMMVIKRQTGEILHTRFKEFPSFLNKGEVLIINDTKVIPAKAWGKKGEKYINFLFLKEESPGLWQVLCRPAKKVKLGNKISFSTDLEGKVIRIEERGKRLIKFNSPRVLERLKKIGYAPLPPYIKRPKAKQSLRDFDLKRYQTIYARRGQAVAAPTAGLHFTPKILHNIQEKGIIIAPLTLDVGLATFQPVRVERVENHKMLAESYSISHHSASLINAALKEKRPIIAVGTTSVRALESAYNQGAVRPGRYETKLFIYPGYRFKVVDKLLTNFHLPKSTLLMLVAAFAGLDLIKKAYQEAVVKKYRFYSYGDCMLII